MAAAAVNASPHVFEDFGQFTSHLNALQGVVVNRCMICNVIFNTFFRSFRNHAFYAEASFKTSDSRSHVGFLNTLIEGEIYCVRNKDTQVTCGEYEQFVGHGVEVIYAKQGCPDQITQVVYRSVVEPHYAKEVAENPNSHWKRLWPETAATAATAAAAAKK